LSSLIFAGSGMAWVDTQTGGAVEYWVPSLVPFLADEDAAVTAARAVHAE
jgi:hypothetical protein